MQVIILAGGLGTRISEESHLRPKPMIEIGDRPILWHIMKYYSFYGFNDFIICAGYKGYMIKQFFSDYYLHMSDITFDFTKENSMTVHNHFAEPWKVTLVDTGLNTMTGGRIKRIEKYIQDDSFMMTYGDGVSDIDLYELLRFHESHGKIATITTVNVSQRFGVIDIDKNSAVKSFREKSSDDGDIINAGFMVLNRGIFEYIEGDETVFEKQPLEDLVRNGELMAFKHTGYWQCMDTQREKLQLEEIWQSGNAPWAKW